MVPVTEQVKALVSTASRGCRWAIVVRDRKHADEMISLVPWYTHGVMAKINRATLRVEAGKGFLQFILARSEVERVKGFEFDELLVTECDEVNVEMLRELEIHVHSKIKH